MKSITVYGADEIIDDIKNTAWKLKMSASRYLIMFHIMQQEKKYPDKVRGSAVARETVEPSKKKTIQDIRNEVDEKVQSMTGFSGPQPKTKQTKGGSDGK